VLFDWDGTLLDSYRVDAQAYLEMFRVLGIRWGLEKLKQHYSPNWYNVYRAARIPRSRWDEADRLWRRYYRHKEARLFSGARAVLSTLRRNYKLGLVTSGSGDRVRQQLRNFKITRRFAVRVFAEDATPRKPHPAPLRLALARLHLAAEECIYIGDAPADIEMARRAGVASVGVVGTSPVPSKLRAAEPDVTIDSVAELPRLLAKFE
jgi:HAD superfamily hydrolase (TIGR01509 family)